ncbi:MAG: GxxExxY protein [Flavobacteriales bacterium]|jgi:GxxExxY protein
MTENEIASVIVQSCMNVHRILGPGLLESTYKDCLHFELVQKGMLVENEKALPLIYKGEKLESGYRVDLLVEKKVIVELKAVETLNPIYFAQLLTYLKLSNRKLGLLINFNECLIKDGIKRVVNNL